MKGKHWIVLVVLAVLALVVLARCDLNGDDGGGSSGGGPHRVRRLISQVWAGSPASNPPLLSGSSWQDLQTGDGITTDDSGEAELDLDGCSGSVYVFKESTIQVSACRKSEQASGLATCSQQGTSFFNVQCAGAFVVDTGSARVTVSGTAFSVSYVPGRRLTLLVVLEGRVRVQPVVDLDTGALGESITVKAPYFLYTLPGPTSPEFGGLPPREPLPLELLPPLVDAVGLEPWMDDLAQRAEQEGVLPAEWPFGAAAVEVVEAVPAVVLAFGGGPLEERNLQQGVLAAIDRTAIREQLFPGQPVDMIARLGADEVDADTVPYDPEFAIATIEAYGLTELRIVYLEGDLELTGVAKFALNGLLQFIPDVSLLPVARDDLDNVVRNSLAAGQSVMWVTR